MTRPKNVDSVELEERLTGALKDYKAGRFKSYRAAARAWNVPKTTLNIERAKGRKPRNQAHEDEQILTAAEEKELARWITRLTIAL
jgi:helix-turn-helix, Psq domain